MEKIMDLPSRKESQLLDDAVRKAAEKRQQLLAENRAAARALLSQLSTVPQVSTISTVHKIRIIA